MPALALTLVVFMLGLAATLAVAAVVGYALEMGGRRRDGRVALWLIIVIGSVIAAYLPRWIQ